jgi:GNAT superfamily N-acetyltransferase
MAEAFMGSLSVRPATAHDVAFCEHLSRTNMAGYLATRGIAWDPVRFRTSWVEFENLMIVAGESPIGLLRLLPEGEVLGLRDLQIVPVHHRRGLGGWAVRQAQAVALQRGHPGVRLRVYAENRARALYARLGFVVEAEAEGTLHMAWAPGAPGTGVRARGR